MTDNTKDPVRAALTKAVTQNEHDMLLTGEECREIRSILAAIPHSEQREMVAAGEPIYQVLCKRMIGGDQWEDVKKSEYDMWIAQRVPCRVVYAAPVAAPVPEAKAGMLTRAAFSNDMYFGIYQKELAEAKAEQIDTLDYDTGFAVGWNTCRDAAYKATGLVVQDYAVPEESVQRVLDYALTEMAKIDATPAAPAVKHEESELVQQLREYAAEPGYSHGDYADTMRQAADALDARSPVAAPDSDELHFNAQRLRNVAKLAGLDIGGDDAMVDSCRGAILGNIASAMRKAAPDSARDAALEEAMDLLDDAGSKLQTDDKSHDFWMGVGAAVQAGENAIRAAMSATAASSGEKGAAS